MKDKEKIIKLNKELEQLKLERDIWKRVYCDLYASLKNQNRVIGGNPNAMNIIVKENEYNRVVTFNN